MRKPRVIWSCLLLGAWLLVGNVWAVPGESEISRAVIQLGSDDFSVRDRAYAQLSAWVEEDPQKLSAMLPREDPDPEVRDRLESLHRLAMMRRSKIFSGIGEGGALAISPDGKWLAVGSGQRIQLWDVEKGVLAREGRTVDEIGRYYSGLVFHPDGKFLVAAPAVGEDDVILWSVDALEEMTRWRSSIAGGINSLALDPMGQLLALGGCSGGVEICEAESGEVRCSWKPHEDQSDRRGLRFGWDLGLFGEY
jgi:hypothetical protein